MNRIDSGQVTTATPARLDFRAAFAADEGLQTRLSAESLPSMVRRPAASVTAALAPLESGCVGERLWEEWERGRAVPLRPPKEAREARQMHRTRKETLHQPLTSCRRWESRVHVAIRGSSVPAFELPASSSMSRSDRAASRCPLRDGARQTRRCAAAPGVARVREVTTLQCSGSGFLLQASKSRAASGFHVARHRPPREVQRIGTRQQRRHRRHQRQPQRVGALRLREQVR